jgi:putative flavoprotein involved in K+ transport
MMKTTAVVIGAGHAGLAMSRRLTERSIDHVVLERGEVANSWRTQRWPSLRLLTPNWLGRLGRITDGVAQFSGSLRNTCTLADLKMNRFLARADNWAAARGLDDELPPPQRFAPTYVDPRSPLELGLTSGKITTVLWATGFRPDHSWLDIPVRDRTGRIRHNGGVVTGAPGLYVLGLPLLRTRASTYIHGAVTDSEALGARLHSFLGSRRSP